MANGIIKYTTAENNVDGAICFTDLVALTMTAAKNDSCNK